MTRKFVMTSAFDHAWKSMGMDDSDLARLQDQLIKNPQIGAVMQGTGGLRKMRFALDKGKSGGSRVTYVDFVIHEVIYLIYAYPKNEKDNLTKEERNQMKKLITAIEQTLGGD